MEEEAARIQPLNHGHHRTAKQPKLELPSPVESRNQSKKNCGGISEKATHRTKDGDKIPQGGMTPRLRSQP